MIGRALKNVEQVGRSMQVMPDNVHFYHGILITIRLIMVGIATILLTMLDRRVGHEDSSHVEWYDGGLS